MKNKIYVSSFDVSRQFTTNSPLIALGLAGSSGLTAPPDAGCGGALAAIQEIMLSSDPIF